MSEFLSILSAVLITFVPIIYFKQLIRGESIPNPGTWLVWLIMFYINTPTYFQVVDENIYKAIHSLTLTIAITIIFLYSLFRGRFAKFGSIEIICLALCIIVFWVATQNILLSNILLQFVFLISFIPTSLGIINGTLREKATSWFIAFLSYFILALAVITDWNQNSWAALAYPIINGMLGNGSVLLAIIFKKH